MTGCDRRLDRARRRAREIIVESGRDLLQLREAAGLSQRAAGRAVGMSGSQYGRIERAEIRELSIEQLARAASAVGGRLSCRIYPDGDPLRDSPQVRLLGRFHGRLPAVVPMRNEVPIPIPGDLRSWDAVLQAEAIRIAVEAETRVRDAQATWRRIMAKARDDPSISRLVLLVADTRRNREAIAGVRELLRADLPLDTRAILAALSRGKAPAANGIVFL